MQSIDTRRGVSVIRQKNISFLKTRSLGGAVRLHGNNKYAGFHGNLMETNYASGEWDVLSPLQLEQVGTRICAVKENEEEEYEG